MAVSSSAGADFIPITQIAYFPPGSEPGNRTCVSIPIIDDSLQEGTEGFTAHLFVCDTAVVATNDVAVCAILDNDSKRLGNDAETPLLPVYITF